MPRAIASIKARNGQEKDMVSRDRSRWTPLLAIALITIGGLAAWLGSVSGLCVVLRLSGWSADLCTRIEALVTTVATATVLGAACLACCTLDQFAASWHMQVRDSLFDELNSPESIKARR